MHAGLILLIASYMLGVQADWGDVIQIGDAKLATAFKNKNFKKISKIFASTSNFSFTQQDSARFSNNLDTAKWFYSLSEAGIVDLDLRTMDITNIGDVANERGIYKLMRADNSVAYSGVYLTNWYLKNGRLQISMSMWT